MLSNIFLFTGEEKYLLHQELNRRTDGFVQKYGADSLFVYKTDDFAFESLRQNLYSGGLFVQKKMIIVYGIPLDNDTSNKLSALIIESFCDEFIGKKGIIDPETLLIFVSYKPDKRTKFYTFLKKELDPKTGIKEFEFLKPYQLKQVISQKTPNLKWSDSSLDLFLGKTGPSLLHIQNEIEKLVLFYQNKDNLENLDKDIEDVTFGITEADNFKFFDLIFVDKNKTIELVSRLQEEGTPWVAFIGTLYRGIKLWLFVIDCFEQNIKDSKTIASTLKASPYSVSKIIKNIDILLAKKKEINMFYKSLIEIDRDIKSGKKSDLNFWLDVKRLVYNL